MRYLTILLILIASPAAIIAETLNVPEEYCTINDAVRAAEDGDTIHVAEGIYKEKIILEKDISIIGAGPGKTVLQATNQKKPEKDKKTPSGEFAVLHVSGNVLLKGITVCDGYINIYVSKDSRLEIEQCEIRGGNDGILFEQSGFNSVLIAKKCVIKGNIDGIDLENTQGMILNTSFVSNNDDGLDNDGDVGVLVYGCEFINNGDDGIETRLQKCTQVIVSHCRFSGNGEDGLEIINSPLADGVDNIVSVQNCVFQDNKRYGVGFVDAKKQIFIEKQFVSAAVYASNNTFKGTTVSPNYLPVLKTKRQAHKTVKITLRPEGGSSKACEVNVKNPILVGIYNLTPAIDGTVAEDCEAVAVLGKRIFVNDDDAKKIYILNRATSAVQRVISTNPFPDSNGVCAKGPEGLDVVQRDGRNVILLSDDDDTSLYWLSLEPDSIGQVISKEPTPSAHLEGIEELPDKTFVGAAGNLLLHAVNDTKSNTITLDKRITVSIPGFGNHIAGIGRDRKNNSLFFTVSGYRRDAQSNRNNAFCQINESLNAVSGLWRIGAFSEDPRGIAVSDGLIYVADGRSHYRDTMTGENKSNGIKIMVFMLNDEANVLENALPFLPLRKNDAE